MARILVVDDQLSVQKMVESILQAKGHAVTSVGSAMDALEAVAMNSFELVITDVMMPGGANGFDLTRTLRADKRTATLPIIILTGRREQRDIEKGIEAGTDDYVIKPIDPDILVAKVDSLLKTRGNQNAHFASVAVVEAAKWDCQTQIVSICEVGMTIRSDLPANIGSKVRVQSDLFEKIGIASPALRVINCQPAGTEFPNAFQIEVHFVGVSEKSLQPLRLWIRSYLLKKSS